MRFSRFMTVSMAVCLPLTVFAQDKITLKNGDVLSGSINTYNAQAVSIDSKYGLLQIPATDIQAITSDNAKVEQIVLGVPEMIEPAAGEDDKPSLWGAKWKGSANLGAELKTGNSDNNALSADASVSARWDKHRAEIQFDYDREEDNSTVSVDKRSLAFIHGYFFKPKWFIENEAKFEQDDIALIDLRSTLSTGLGYQAYERDDLNLKFVLGGGYIGESYENGTSDDALAVKWSLDYDQKFKDDAFRLFHNHDITSPADDFGAYLFQSKSGIRLPLKAGIIASAQVDFDWDNDPATGTQEDDTTYSLKLGYEW